MPLIAGEVASAGSNPVTLSIVFFVLALVPLIALAVTSYIKISVVLAILRSALGAGQLPGGAVVSVLALVLSVQVMAPTGRAMFQAANVEIAKGPSEQRALSGGANKGAVVAKGSPASGKKVRDFAERTGETELARLLRVLAAAKEPLEQFLFRNSKERERLFFAKLAEERSGSSLSSPAPVASEKTAETSAPAGTAESEKPPPQVGLFELIPAFLLTELEEAFLIGFSLFIPFLVIDLVVTNLLVGLGMTMVSPITISLPLKLLLFVGCDGWFALSRGLILGYN